VEDRQFSNRRWHREHDGHSSPDGREHPTERRKDVFCLGYHFPACRQQQESPTACLECPPFAPGPLAAVGSHMLLKRHARSFGRSWASVRNRSISTVPLVNRTTASAKRRAHVAYSPASLCLTQQALISPRALLNGTAIVLILSAEAMSDEVSGREPVGPLSTVVLMRAQVYIDCVIRLSPGPLTPPCAAGGSSDRGIRA
jgi:hypothetical protein